jgi:hypothetical protein
MQVKYILTAVRIYMLGFVEASVCATLTMSSTQCKLLRANLEFWHTASQLPYDGETTNTHDFEPRSFILLESLRLYIPQ